MESSRASRGKGLRPAQLGALKPSRTDRREAIRIAYAFGARPNFVKTAPVIAEMRRRLPEAHHVLIHTGQHYDPMMSEVFLGELGVGEPDHRLGVGSASHAVQTAHIMERVEPIFEEERPDLVLVPGDVNSTLAVALVAAKMQIPLGHIESGLRSFDRAMPEEINRIVADQFSDFLFIHSPEAIDNLRREGVPGDRIHFVGNTMIDSLVAVEARFRGIRAAERVGVNPGEYLLVTLHRPVLVDGPLLGSVMERLAVLSRELPVVFPVHPRTRKQLGGVFAARALHLIDPVGYLDYLSLEADAAGVLTDSGGVQEETTFLGVPCFTLRDNTERPITVDEGTNTLLGLDPERIDDIPAALNSARGKKAPDPPPLWDGRAASRLVDVLERRYAALAVD